MNIEDRFVHMFAYIANWVMSMESVRGAMTVSWYMVDLLGRHQVKLCVFDLTSPVCKHHTELEWFCHARKSKNGVGYNSFHAVHYYCR